MYPSVVAKEIKSKLVSSRRCELKIIENGANHFFIADAWRTNQAMADWLDDVFDMDSFANAYNDQPSSPVTLNARNLELMRRLLSKDVSSG